MACSILSTHTVKPEFKITRSHRTRANALILVFKCMWIFNHDIIQYTYSIIFNDDIIVVQVSLFHIYFQWITLNGDLKGLKETKHSLWQYCLWSLWFATHYGAIQKVCLSRRVVTVKQENRGSNMFIETCLTISSLS